MQGRKPLFDSSVKVVQLRQNQEFDALEPKEHHIERATILRPALKPAETLIWDDIAPKLVMVGRLKPIYVHALADYCKIVVRLNNALDKLDANEWEYVTTGRHGTQYKARPVVAQYNDDWRKWRSLMAEFGLSPASERGMGDQNGDLFNDFDEYR